MGARLAGARGRASKVAIAKPAEAPSFHQGAGRFHSCHAHLKGHLSRRLEGWSWLLAPPQELTI